MTALHLRRVAALILIVAAAPSGTSAIAQETPPEADRLTNAEIEALYRARRDSARMRFTEADVAFVTGMIPHHAQALIMSELAPTRGASPAVQTLAARIINAQADEIALMQKWLADRGQPVPEVKINGLDLMIEMPPADEGGGHEGHDMHADHMDHSGMPGMLSPDQLDELASASGPEFDRLFLTYMIGHHQGAVTMVDELFSVDGAGQDGAVFKLASDVQVDQITEIERMKLMLDDMAAPAETGSSR